MKKENKLIKWIVNTHWGKIVSTIVLTIIIEIVKCIKIQIDMENLTPYLQIMIPLISILLILYFIQWIRKKYQQKLYKTEYDLDSTKCKTKHDDLIKYVDKITESNSEQEKKLVRWQKELKDEQLYHEYLLEIIKKTLIYNKVNKVSLYKLEGYNLKLILDDEKELKDELILQDLLSKTSFYETLTSVIPNPNELNNT